MCGIVGVVGKQQTKEILIQGLEKLEYRGYDSAGIFVTSPEGENYLVKSVGRIDNLKKKLTKEVSGTIGIGHTRWATHGKPTEENAHPHTSRDGRFMLVHNGVIENFEELKAMYLEDVPLKGETDTEVLVQIISVFVAKHGLDTLEAFRKIVRETKGSYALALIDTNERETIYVAKNKSPLLVGVGDDFNVICSDAMAMISQTNQFVELMDGEIVLVSKDKIIIEDQAQQRIERDSFTVEMSENDLGKGTYPYYMLKEIDEQPAVMRNLIQQYSDAQSRLTVEEDILKAVTECDRIYIVACGTSWHAGWIGKKLLEKYVNIPTEVHLSSEFGYNMPLLAKKPFFIFLSQSGETADSRQVLVKLNEMKLPSLVITNAKGSTLSREATYTMLLHAGPEIAVASTKAYTAQIAVLAILAKVCGETQAATKVQAQTFDLVHELGLVATAMESLIDEKDQVEKLAEDYLKETRNAFYIGRGQDYYVSMEAALKLKEISYIQAEGFAAGELKHGTIALIEEGTPVISMITDTATHAHTRGNIKEVESRGAHTCVMAMEGFERPQDQLILPKVHEDLTPLISVIPAQLLAYFATLQRGYDVDKPRNLAKSVTVE
ncbi:glutamine--fructose-6-phosphate transaminase (isomerizing) [Vagococcus entomophilus]|uniref:Glutamine--fructose-6-phosphate aminotransferase [isomerizing] n=1 Tax=Vagococcus entomophilus TaxID=1160095 RepID=A0A430AKF0_9ENTE|nr:glutamine--fructose-6-phosphate transaminase (isomerizing) [Vagococcus entomophilus]RSU08592.1 glutamine--fructose-6-phosphate transaminase (isomerizing) [Vagococcus entomophilus]